MRFEEGFAQDLQQRFIDERGGADGRNYERAREAVWEHHAGAHTARQLYDRIRAFRAPLMGAGGAEIIHEAVRRGYQHVEIPPCTVPGNDIAMLAEHLPEPFVPIYSDLLAGFHTLAEADGEPSARTTEYAFYEGAHRKYVDEYWRTRIAARDTPGGTERAKEYWKRARAEDGFKRHVMPSTAVDNVVPVADVLMAMGAALCVAKRDTCSAEDLCEFVVHNLDVAVALTSIRRRVMHGKNPPLPDGYGKRLLEGVPSVVNGNMYLRATKEAGGWQVHWVHRALQKGHWNPPGYCPASIYNRLHARTEAQSAAIRGMLGEYGLDSLLEAQGGRTASGQLVLIMGLGVAVRSVFQQSEWQERLLCAQRDT